MKRVTLITAFRDGLLLMGKRNDNGKYTLPGGKAEEGEELIDAARRELEEETGLSPSNELVLIDQRQFENTQISTFECNVEGAPTGKNDPDQECGVWGFYDISNGIPKTIAENMVGSKKPEDNFLCELMGLEKKEQDDEIDRLLLNPSPIERKMALKLRGVGDKHLIRAMADDDPEIQRQAIRHSNQSHNSLLALMQMPNRSQLQLLALSHPNINRDHLQALYHTHKNSPIQEKRNVLHGISNHDKLDPALISTMVGDGNGQTVVDNLRTPPNILSQIVEQHLAQPQDTIRKRLARSALRHPAMDKGLLDRSLKEGDDDIKLAAAMNEAHLNSDIAYDIFMRGQFPEHDNEAFLRSTLLNNPLIQQKHLAVAVNDRNELVRQAANSKATASFQKSLNDFNSLAKAVVPKDFAGLLRASDNNAPSVVNHKPDVKSHPIEHSADVNAYKNHVVKSPKPVKRLDGGKKKVDGASPKIVYTLPEDHPTHPNVGYLVKPYHERVPRKFQVAGKQPYHGGWAEMTNQALYHAGGIGHLHQKVHVSEHNLGNSNPAEPALVVRMDPSMKMIYDHPTAGDNGTEGFHENARRVALMDFLSNNLDRNPGNLLVNHPKDRANKKSEKFYDKLLAIDHGRSFQYNNTHPNLRIAKESQPKEITDNIGNYMDYSSLKDAEPWKRDSKSSHNGMEKRAERWSPTFDWWGQNSNKIKEAFSKRLEQIKDPDIKAHLKRNFEARAHVLDDKAKFGLENFGTDWHNDEVPLYRPGQLTEKEREEKVSKKA